MRCLPPLRKPSAQHTRGVALIIVLAFIVLLTGLVVAFFSRSLSERQISNGSAGQVKVDLFTQGAIATITSDLKQEIAAGSNATYYTDTNGKLLGSVYLPANPVAAAPALALKGQQTTVTAFPRNLLKRSAYKQNFFPGSGDPGAANYNANGTNTAATVVEPPTGTPGPTPTPAATVAPTPSSRAADLSSTLTTRNGRSISPARWNKALLLPKQDPSSATDNTPYTVDPGNPKPATTPKPAPSGASFVPPDWVLVARDGSHPGSSAKATFSGAGAVNNASPSNAGFVTGRYAYTIYDEGGLLDANVAGYPTKADKYPSNPSLTPPIPVLPQGKTALAYADLTIPVPVDAAVADPSSNLQPNLLTGAQVNALVGWRNYASSVPDGGAFPNYTPSATTSPSTGTPAYSLFDISVLTNRNGFMGISNTPLNGTQSDRMFGSRQELINFFLQGLPDSSKNTTAIAALQNSLQYFGTFSRGLSQPSYAPVPRTPSATNQSPRPLIQPAGTTGSQTNGGNNVGDSYTTTAQQDYFFNPALLSVRALAAFTRNDGTTTAVVGEPLLKGRFALQRLAWITYKGPSADNMSDANVLSLRDNYGISTAYLQKGTKENIQNYFGLIWDSLNHRWKYNIHNGGTASAAGTGTGAIMKLQDIAYQRTREPDFFEILKASVDVAALGKAGILSKQAEPGEPSAGGPNSHVLPLNFQFYRDVNVDAAIIQLGANIIDQFDLDGFPTRILFNDGSAGSIGNGDREFRGVENLPYIYRVRLGTLKVREASTKESQGVPVGTGDFQVPYQHSGTPMPGITQSPLRDTGVGIIMAVPDIWNPHDQNSSLGSPRPGTTSPGSTGLIRLVANSATPDTVFTTADPPPATPANYSTFTAGTFIGTDDAHGGYRATSYINAITPDPAASPEPIPFFTRGPNPLGKATTGIMSGSNGGFNNPHYVDTITASYLTFKVPDEKYYREPTLLALADPAGPSGLTMVVNASNLDIRNITNASGAAMYVDQYGLKSANPLNGGVPNPLQLPTAPNPLTQAYCGITLGTYPLRWVGPRWSGATANTLWNYTGWSAADAGSPTAAICYSLQYQDPQAPSKWITYDEKYIDSDLSFVNPWSGLLVQPKGGAYSFVDPRTPRLGSPTENNISGAPHYRAPLAFSGNWLDQSGKILPLITERPDIASGFGSNFRAVGDWGLYASPGLHTQNINVAPPDKGVDRIFFQTGLLAQNNPYFPSDGKRFSGDAGVGASDAIFVSDADGVVRRAMGAYVPVGGTTVGQPLATATAAFSGGVGTPTSQSQSRPIILNHPFRSVAELGYVFSGNPWKNIDFSTPESAYSELLDVFCVSDTAPSDGLLAGTVDLNTRQPWVLKAILTGASADEQYGTSIKGGTPVKPLTPADAESMASLLTARTSSAPPAGTFYASKGPQPLQSVGDLVGRWNSKQTITGNFTPGLGNIHNVDGSKSYDGFSGDLSSVSTANLSTDTIKISRVRESAVRALSTVGNTRVWNLMIDVIAQSGRYPPTTSTMKTTDGAVDVDNFVVDGEQRCWIHLAVDRYTGNILDTKLEIVKE